MLNQCIVALKPWWIVVVLTVTRTVNLVSGKQVEVLLLLLTSLCFRVAAGLWYSWSLLQPCVTTCRTLSKRQQTGRWMCLPVGRSELLFRCMRCLAAYFLFYFQSNNNHKVYCLHTYSPNPSEMGVLAGKENANAISRRCRWMYWARMQREALLSRKILTVAPASYGNVTLTRSRQHHLYVYNGPLSWKKLAQ